LKILGFFLSEYIK